MKKYVFFITVVLTLLLNGVPASAYVGLCCAKCGGNMPLNIVGAGVPETHEFRFKLSPMFMKMEGLRDGQSSVNGDSLLGMPAMGKYMAVPTKMDMRMLNFAAGYSFTDDFFAGLMFMYKKNEMEMKFNSMMAGPMQANQPGFTMKSDGLGDVMLMTKYRLYTDDPYFPKKQVSLFLGLGIPTGSIDEKNSTHPLAMRQGEQLPYSMQIGSGTFDPMAGIVYQASSSPWWWGVNAIYTGRFYDNKRDYRLGNEFRYDLYGMYQFRYDLVGHIQLNGHYWGKIGGEMDEAKDGTSGRSTKGDPASTYMTPLWDTGNYGGHKILATAGIQWQPVPLQILDFVFSVPAYQRLNGPQLEEDYRVMFTWYVEIPTKKSIRHPDHKGGRFPGAGEIPGAR